MKIKIGSKTISMRKDRVRIFTKISEHETSVIEKFYNPIRNIRSAINNWHHKWAMDRLRDKRCKCGELIIKKENE